MEVNAKLPYVKEVEVLSPDIFDKKSRACVGIGWHA